jgi:hypothetical protein
MIKKAHRKQLTDEPELQYEKMHKKFTSSLNLVNYIFKNLFRVPKGYHLCPGCKAIEPLRVSNTKRIKNNYFKSNLYDYFGFCSCELCEGKGYVDFVTNAMKQTNKIYWNNGFSISILASELTIKEIASTMLYLVYDKNNYNNFDINFKKPNLNKLKSKKAKDFVEYFSEYKKQRDKRKRFIEKNSESIRSEIFKLTKITDIPKGKQTCDLCKGQPIDIFQNEYFDTIEMGICGKCYGFGYQSKKDTLPIYRKCIFPLIESNYPNKKEITKLILWTAIVCKSKFVDKLNKIQERENKTKNIKKRKAA